MKNLAGLVKESRYLDKIICILFVCFLLAMFELLSRAVLPPGDELYQILGVLQQDSELFWRQRPNLNADFQGARVRTNSCGLRIRDKNFNPKKDKETFRIVCLGASPTFGWGVEAEDSYPYRLERVLEARGGLDKRVEVINAGNIGYSSYQGLLFLKKQILRLSPDLITVSYVANDVDKHRFYRSGPKADKELSPKNKALVILENIFNRSKLFKALGSAILQARGINTKHYGKPQDIYPESRRVSPRGYRRNLNKIINIARHNKTGIVLIKMPIGLPFEEKNLSHRAIDKANRSIASGLTHLESDRHDEAIAEFKKALEYNPYSARAFYYLGICYNMKREPEEAETYFQKAKEMEFFECAKLSRVYNEIMQQVADKKRVALVDAVLAFETFARTSDEPLYVNSLRDYLHPSVTGHKIISEGLADRLIRSNLLPGSVDDKP